MFFWLGGWEGFWGRVSGIGRAHKGGGGGGLDTYFMLGRGLQVGRVYDDGQEAEADADAWCCVRFCTLRGSVDLDVMSAQEWVQRSINTIHTYTVVATSDSPSPQRRLPMRDGLASCNSMWSRSGLEMIGAQGGVPRGKGMGSHMELPLAHNASFTCQSHAHTLEGSWRPVRTLFPSRPLVRSSNLDCVCREIILWCSV